MATIKTDPRLQEIPVIILTDYADKKLIQTCYRSGAASVIKKPLSEQSTKKKDPTLF